MSSLSSDVQRAVIAVIAGIALIAVLWMTVIAPKRSDSADARAQADAQQQKLDATQAKVGSYRTAKANFAPLKRELRRLDRAVPARGAVSELLRELQAEAGRRGAELRIVALKDPGAAPPPAAGTTGAPGPVPTPGATPGPGGLSVLPFSLQFTGKYFDLVSLLRTVRRAVTEKDGKVTAKGRLLTIDGLTFQRPDRASSVTQASMNATAYVAGPAPEVPAASTAANTNASNSPTASTPGAP